MHALHPCPRQDLCVWNPAPPLDFQQPSQTAQVEMAKPPRTALAHRPGPTRTQEGRQHHSPADPQLGVKLDSTSLPDICTESSECHTSPRNSGSDLIINMHRSGESASQVGELVNNPQLLPTHSDGWPTTWPSGRRPAHNPCPPALIVRS